MTNLVVALFVFAVLGRMWWDSISLLNQIVLVALIVLLIPVLLGKVKRRKRKRRKPDAKPEVPQAYDRYGWTYVWWSPEGRPYIGESIRPEVRDREHFTSGRLPIGPGWECVKKCWPSKEAAQEMEQVIYDQLVAEGHKPLNRIRPHGAPAR